MAVLTVQKNVLTGLNPALSAAAAGGDKFKNDGRSILHVKNAHTGPITVTVNSLKNCNLGFDHDVTVTVNAGSSIQLGPFDPVRFNNNAGEVSLTYTAATALTVGVVSLGK